MNEAMAGGICATSDHRGGQSQDQQAEANLVVLRRATNGGSRPGTGYEERVAQRRRIRVTQLLISNGCRLTLALKTAALEPTIAEENVKKAVEGQLKSLDQEYELIKARGRGWGSRSSRQGSAGLMRKPLDETKDATLAGKVASASNEATRERGPTRLSNEPRNVTKQNTHTNQQQQSKRGKPLSQSWHRNKRMFDGDGIEKIGFATGAWAIDSTEVTGEFRRQASAAELRSMWTKAKWRVNSIQPGGLYVLTRLAAGHARSATAARGYSGRAITTEEATGPFGTVQIRPTKEFYRIA